MTETSYGYITLPNNIDISDPSYEEDNYYNIVLCKYAV